MTQPLEQIHSAVLTWFDEHRRDLPWRRPGTSAWGVLVSEVMLQQTPVARVEPVWLAWMSQWPTPADLAAATPAQVLRMWGRLGYPRRALRLQQCAAAISDEHGGVVPRDTDALLALPGVGSYTAAAVRAFAYGERDVVLDTNVRRVLVRLRVGQALPVPSLTRTEEADAAAAVPLDVAASVTWNIGLMELGALVCTARAPRCESCPLARWCRWRAAGYPADEHRATRRRQAWHGTDRQARGRIMAALRSAVGPLDEAALPTWGDDVQRQRVLASLVADGLIEVTTPGRFQLPGEASAEPGGSAPGSPRP